MTSAVPEARLLPCSTSTICGGGLESQLLCVKGSALALVAKSSAAPPGTHQVWVCPRDGLGGLARELDRVDDDEDAGRDLARDRVDQRGEVRDERGKDGRLARACESVGRVRTGTTGVRGGPRRRTGGSAHAQAAKLASLELVEYGADAVDLVGSQLDVGALERFVARMIGAEDGMGGWWTRQRGVDIAPGSRCGGCRAAQGYR